MQPLGVFISEEEVRNEIGPRIVPYDLTVSHTCNRFWICAVEVL